MLGALAALGAALAGKTFRGMAGVGVSSSPETDGGSKSWPASSLAARSESVSSSGWASTEKYDFSRVGIAFSGTLAVSSVETPSWQHGEQ